MKQELSDISKYKVIAGIGVASLSLVFLSVYFYKAWGVAAVIVTVLGAIMFFIAVLSWGIESFSDSATGFSVVFEDAPEYEDDES